MTQASTSSLGTVPTGRLTKPSGVRKKKMSKAKEFLGGLEEQDLAGDAKKAKKVLQGLLKEFLKTGHAFELLGSSDELMKVDDFRDLLKKLTK